LFGDEVRCEVSNRRNDFGCVGGVGGVSDGMDVLSGVVIEECVVVVEGRGGQVVE